MEKDYEIFKVDDFFTGLIDNISISTDGVGSKIKLAQKLNKYDTIGIDCVAMNVNDVICIGAKPIAFVDYIKAPNRDHIKELSKGLLKGCEIAKIPLIGGETSIYGNDLDISGTVIGKLINKKIDGSDISKNDIIIGLHSSGMHSNGFTLAKKYISLDKTHLEPTLIYSLLIEILVKNKLVSGLANITGGGLNNLYRLKIKKELKINITSMIEPPTPFLDIYQNSNLSLLEMQQHFNMGIGFCIITTKLLFDSCIDAIKSMNYKFSVIGYIS